MHMRITTLLAALCFCIACASDKDDFGGDAQEQPHERLNETPPELRDELAPNELFRAVLNNSPGQVRSASLSTPDQIHSLNANGDSPLGLALRYGLKESAEELITVLSAHDARTTNGNGDTYIYLAARAGYHGMITRLANLHYSSLNALNDFEFGDLDLENADGRTALFVAANRQVAETLEAQYYRGFLEYPFWGFTMKLDHSDKTFLHTAAADGREDVILWAADRACQASSWESSHSWWQSLPAILLSRLTRGIQTFAEGWAGPAQILFNRRDVDGKTAMHLALESRRWRTARALASCRWLDYDLPDNSGNLPLHSFLQSLNPMQKTLDQESKEIFDFVTSQNTKMRQLTQSPSNRVNTINQEGETALHLAARLADPYFFQRLRSIGDVYIKNREGITAEELFKKQRQQLRQNAY